jgi:MATE family multidrug resistance protein
MFSKEYFRNYKLNLKLAYPIMIGQAGHIFANIADSVMVGHIGSNYLAAAAISSSIFFVMFIAGIGISIGLTPLVGVAHGENNYHEAGEYLKASLMSFPIIGIVLTLFNIGIIFIFDYLGQPSEVIYLAKPFYLLLSMTIVPYLIYMSFKQFTEGLALTLPAMVISLSCNFFNVILNYVLINGYYGFPRLELNGAGISTLISKILMAAIFAIYIFSNKKFKIYINPVKWLKISKNHIIRILKLGLPIGLQSILEVGVFSVGGIIVGWFGKDYLAAHQIALSLASFTFLAASGIGSAATIRLSNLSGEHNYQALKISGKSSFILVLTFMSICALVFMLFRKQLAMFYINEPQVIAIAAQFIVIAGFFQLFDGTQVTALGALRGLKDVKIPTYIAFTSYWLVGLTSAYLLSVTFNFGAIGVWYGFLISLFTASTLLTLRFFYLLKSKYNFK